MKRVLATAIVMLLTASFAAEGQSPKFAPAQLQEDFQIARRALEEGHSGIYRYTKKSELDSDFDRAMRSLDRPMDAFEFFRLMAPVVAHIKCGHTSIALPAELRQELTTRAQLLPLQVRVLDKKPFVFRDFSSPERRLSGLEIVSINGVPAAKIISTMLAAVPADGDVESSRQARISDWRFNAWLVALLDLKSPYEVVLRDTKTKREQQARLTGIELPKLTEASKAAYPQDQPRARAGEMIFFDDGRIALMKIYGFGGLVDLEKKTGLREFYKASFEEFQTKGTKSLIIDLRNNGGGEDDLGKLLLSYLIDQPFKYYDDLVINNNTFSFMKYAGQPDFKLPEKIVEQGKDGKYHAVGHPNWGINQPNKPRFAGKVYILINGGSFSTTSEFLSQAHFHKRATFIGEESAGGYYGNSSGFMPSVTLPNTKLALRVPLMTYYMAVSGYEAASHGLVPDHPLAHTIEDLITGRDPDMELALKLARKQ